MRFTKNNPGQYIGEDAQERANDKMPTTQPKNQRICAKCIRAFYGNMDSILCPECAKISLSQNVVMQRICTDCGHKKEISRPLGSMDICQLCGREYIVEGVRQKYCHNCQKQLNQCRADIKRGSKRNIQTREEAREA